MAWMCKPSDRSNAENNKEVEHYYVWDLNLLNSWSEQTSNRRHHLYTICKLDACEHSHAEKSAHLNIVRTRSTYQDLYTRHKQLCTPQPIAFRVRQCSYKGVSALTQSESGICDWREQGQSTFKMSMRTKTDLVSAKALWRDFLLFQSDRYSNQISVPDPCDSIIFYTYTRCRAALGVENREDANGERQGWLEEQAWTTCIVNQDESGARRPKLK